MELIFLLDSVELRNCIYFREFENLGREREVERIGPGKSKTQVRTVNSFTPIGLFFPSSTPARINKNMCF